LFGSFRKDDIKVRASFQLFIQEWGEVSNVYANVGPPPSSAFLLLYTICPHTHGKKAVLVLVFILVKYNWFQMRSATYYYYDLLSEYCTL